MITKSNIKNIHAEIDDALKAIAAKHGLVLKPTRLRYNATMLQINGMEMVAPTASGLDPREEEAFNYFAKFDGLEKALQGTFLYRNEAYKLVGYVAGRKTCYKTIRSKDGQTVFFPPSLLKVAANKSWEK